MLSDNFRRNVRSSVLLLIVGALWPLCEVRAGDPQHATVYFLDGRVGVKLHPTGPASLYGSVQCGSSEPPYAEAIRINDSGINQWSFRFNMAQCADCKRQHGYITLDNSGEGIAVYSSNTAAEQWKGYIDLNYHAPHGATIHVLSLEDPNDPIPRWDEPKPKVWKSIDLDATKTFTDKSLKEKMDPGKVVLLVSKYGNNIDIRHVTFQPSK